jgi:hypothetical protein
MPVLGVRDQTAGFTALKQMYDAVIKVDQVLYQYAIALETVQPPAPGKIALRFLKRRDGESDSRHPVFVQWYKGKSGRWLYSRLKTGQVIRHMKSYSVFLRTREDTKELLEQARHLVQLRESLFKGISDSQRKHSTHSVKVLQALEPFASHLDGIQPKLAAQRAAIIEESRKAKEASAAMLPEGVEVETETMPRTHYRKRTRGFKDRPE